MAHHRRLSGLQLVNTVGELIILLSGYPVDAPVLISTAEGTDERIISIETNEDDTPDIEPLVVFICSERN